MKRRFTTKDGHRVGEGDRVWSENHLPWVVRRIAPLGPGAPKDGLWAFVDADPAFEPQPDLDSTLLAPGEDFPEDMYRHHPNNPSYCDSAGCRDRPWGAC